MPGKVPEIDERNVDDMDSSLRYSAGTGTYGATSFNFGLTATKNFLSNEQTLKIHTKTDEESRRADILKE